LHCTTDCRPSSKVFWAARLSLHCSRADRNVVGVVGVKHTRQHSCRHTRQRSETHTSAFYVTHHEHRRTAHPHQGPPAPARLRHEHGTFTAACLTRADISDQITLSIAAGTCPSFTSRLLTRETGTAAQIKCRV
jgi:hypothetical protein